MTSHDQQLTHASLQRVEYYICCWLLLLLVNVIKSTTAQNDEAAIELQISNVSDAGYPVWSAHFWYEKNPCKGYTSLDEFTSIPDNETGWIAISFTAGDDTSWTYNNARDNFTYTFGHISDWLFSPTVDVSVAVDSPREGIVTDPSPCEASKEGHGSLFEFPNTCPAGPCATEVQCKPIYDCLFWYDRHIPYHIQGISSKRQFPLGFASCLDELPPQPPMSCLVRIKPQSDISSNDDVGDCSSGRWSLTTYWWTTRRPLYWLNTFMSGGSDYLGNWWQGIDINLSLSEQLGIQLLDFAGFWCSLGNTLHHSAVLSERRVYQNFWETLEADP